MRLFKDVLPWVFAFLLTFPVGVSAQENERLIEHNGAKLFYKIIGSGEPLLVIHGGPGLDHTYFLPHLEKMADSLQLIFVDVRGSGRSRDTSLISMKQTAEDVDVIRKALGIQKLNLLGHSHGGLVAMNYAVSYPENMKKLILVTPNPAKVKRPWWRPKSKWSSRNKKPLAHYDQSFANYDLLPALRMITFPSLLITAEGDYTSFAVHKPILYAIPGCKHVRMKGAGHFPFRDKPGEFDKIVTDFILKEEKLISTKPKRIRAGWFNWFK